MGADFIWWCLLAIVFATEFTLAYRKYLRTYSRSQDVDKTN